MNHEDYKSSALSESPKIKVAKTTHIVSNKHNLYTVDRIKRKLSCYNEKRYMENMYMSMSHGHYKLNKDD